MVFLNYCYNRWFRLTDVGTKCNFFQNFLKHWTFSGGFAAGHVFMTPLRSFLSSTLELQNFLTFNKLWRESMCSFKLNSHAHETPFSPSWVFAAVLKLEMLPFSVWIGETVQTEIKSSLFFVSKNCSGWLKVDTNPAALFQFVHFFSSGS